MPPRKCLLSVLALLVISAASSRVSAEPNSQVRSVYEPGSLGQHQLGVRAGFAVADGPPGFGGELFWGLGRVDLSAGLSGMSVTVFGKSDTVAFGSLAAQALVRRWGQTRLSARTMIASELTDTQRAHMTNELRLSTGSASRRLLVGGGALIDRGAEGDYSTGLFGHAGVHWLSRGSVGVTLLAVVLAEPGDVTPLASLNLSFQ